MLRVHIIICCVLLMLCIPVYLLDNYWLKSSGRDWISLNFKNVLIWTYVAFIGLHILLSTLVIFSFHHSKLFTVHLYSAILSLVLLSVGFFAFEKIKSNNSSGKDLAKMEHRKSLYNNIRLTRWWFLPDARNPNEIHVDLEVAASGRFSGQVIGKEDGETGRIILSSDGEIQRTVHSGETFHYVFPLNILYPGQAKHTEFTFYLFTSPTGQSGEDDIYKIYKDSVVNTDDGSYFYGKLLPPLDEIPK